MRRRASSEARLTGAMPELGSLVFPAVGAERRVEAVVRRIGEAISLGLIEVGERLPAESDLAARFDVSQVTLREALAILRDAGLLETRRGRGGGTFVRGYAPVPGADRFRDVAPADIRDLVAYGRAVSGAAAALAARHAGARELEHVRELAERTQAAGSLGDLLRADGRLHVVIAAGSQAARLTRAEIEVQSELNELLALLPDERHVLELVRRQHGALVEAVARRDSAAARAHAEEHVETMGDLIIGLGLPRLETTGSAPRRDLAAGGEP